MIAKMLVDLLTAIPDCVLDIRYATARNFLGRAVYPAPRALLHESAAAKAAAAADALRREGLRLVVHDAYRPLSVQRLMWALTPDRRFVADPARGSQHNRAAALDCALADREGKPLPMPSEYDEFTHRSSHSYRGGDPAALERRAVLRRAMEGAGFRALEAEWWHYSDPDGAGWPLLDEPLV
jgi:D-alanyl-D-alanine dipeptidase